ncbi:competence type IV pilus major pilin ComGC [Nocardioides bizhenqiangii]|uniref:Prepilin-type N-terminal cleavage/methylation domain-containing protein n=1 Tax=Nocardioides bizhenqiangii TaxID=3095076 RepID=A0ABZ0ZPK0_9ACTN|nr:prepilin-type N-terminal cleavage/methylation domain-containing protein [Nocardioides sp. HM61]WQQ26232.1 prepilin-type N-terminal cleavage/methylation domain-containing protein [Nocardioides sp. HM61]
MLKNTTNRVRDLRRDDNGFTLIELLMVIIILAILAAVVVFSVRAIDDNGEQAACEAEVRAVETAVEARYADRGSYPNTVGQLVTEGFLRDDPGEASTLVPATTVSNTGVLGNDGGC